MENKIIEIERVMLREMGREDLEVLLGYFKVNREYRPDEKIGISFSHKK